MKKIGILAIVLLALSIQAQAQNIEDLLKGTDKSNPNAIIESIQGYMSSLTYEEFEAMAIARIPNASKFTRAKCKKDYNEHHQNDGKAVKIYPVDYTTYLGGGQAQETANKNKKDSTRMAINNDNSSNNGGFDLGDLFGGGNNSSNNGNSGNNSGGSIDLGGILDAMESDEAAELGKQAEEVDLDNIEQQMKEVGESYGITENAEESSLNFRKKMGIAMARGAGIADEEGFADAFIAYDDANRDESMSVEEREQKGREYFRYSGATQGWVEVGVGMTVNRDPQKIKQEHKIDKDPEEENLEPLEIDEVVYAGFSIREIAYTYTMNQLEQHYGIKVPRDMSERQMFELTIKFIRGVKANNLKGEAVHKYFDEVAQEYLLSKAG